MNAITESHYQTIFDSMSVSIWECDVSGLRVQIAKLGTVGPSELANYLAKNPSFIRQAMDQTRALDVNAASIRLFGATRKEELLAPVSQVWPPESEHVYARALIAACNGEERFEAEAKMRRLDGTLIDVLFTVAVPMNKGLTDHIFVAIADLTEHSRTLADLLAAQIDLAQATRLTNLGALTTSIAHEVNQPLAGIISNGQAGLRWLRRDEPDLAAVERSLQCLVLEAQRAASVIGRVRDLAGQVAEPSSRFDLNKLVDDSVQLLWYELRRGHVEIVLDLDRAVPLVLADRIQMQQVVINLLMNGIQAMAGPADRSLRLYCSTTVSSEGVLVTVSDEGPGVPAEARENLFDPFCTTKPEGMGLGLFLCRTILERYGGRIWIVDQTDEGATFNFWLPTQAPEARL